MTFRHHRINTYRCLITITFDSERKANDGSAMKDVENSGINGCAGGAAVWLG